ncbi:MAG: EutN/CcmL family microcompartment protein [Candidatus Coatesbacteria bacterium]|nr:EutN/CcmL family microcompartment protein [Candidatus Coatesbacteria bacterium]
MFVAEVTGSVVVPQKHAKLTGRKLLAVRMLDRDGRMTESELIAVDTVGAGVGERVLVVKEGGSAAMAMGIDKPPANVVIVGIIDSVNLEATG